VDEHRRVHEVVRAAAGHEGLEELVVEAAQGCGRILAKKRSATRMPVFAGPSRPRFALISPAVKQS
jgi:hypothetical protein